MPSSFKLPGLRLAASIALAGLAACGDYNAGPAYPTETPTLVDLSFCALGAPRWVAFQDGDGAWTRAEPSPSGNHVIYHAAFLSNRGGIATANDFASGLTSLAIQYGTPAEIAAAGNAICDFGGDRSLQGTVAGLDTNEIAIIKTGTSAPELASPNTNNEFELVGLSPGPQEILATRLTQVADDDVQLTAIIVRRLAELPDHASIPVLDFNSNEALPPVFHDVTIGGAGTDAVRLISGFRIGGGLDATLFVSPSLNSTTRAYAAVPQQLMGPEDLQLVSASTLGSNASNVARSVTQYFRTPGHRDLDFGAPPVRPDITIEAAIPTARLRTRFVSQGDYDRMTSVNFQQGQTIVSLSMTSGYVAASGRGYDLVIPEFSTVSGFEARWALTSGTPVIWTISRIGGTLGPRFDAVPFDGAVRRVATDAGFITP